MRDASPLGQVPWHIGAIGIGFVLIVLLLLLWRLPIRKATRLDLRLKEQFDIENETRKTWATIVGGMAVLFSLLFTWENLRITQETATTSQNLTREGQITELLTRAIDQLGAVNEGKKQLEIRLGGIYALERIARDSERDHWPIMEVLTAYVRENAPRQDYKTYKETPSAKPEADIQAILTVLERRTWRSSEKEADQRLNLAHTNLRGADLRGAYLERAIFWGAHLHGAILDNAHLEGADFAGAGMQGASLVKAHLKKAMNLTAQQLSAVKILHGADLDPDSPLPEQIRQQYPHRLHIWEKPKD